MWQVLLYNPIDIWISQRIILYYFTYPQNSMRLIISNIHSRYVLSNTYHQIERITKMPSFWHIVSTERKKGEGFFFSFILTQNITILSEADLLVLFHWLEAHYVLFSQSETVGNFTVWSRTFFQYKWYKSKGETADSGTPKYLLVISNHTYIMFDGLITQRASYQLSINTTSLLFFPCTLSILRTCSIFVTTVAIVNSCLFHFIF
jgi:hypothetical protein